MIQNIQFNWNHNDCITTKGCCQWKKNHEKIALNFNKGHKSSKSIIDVMTLYNPFDCIRAYALRVSIFRRTKISQRYGLAWEITELHTQTNKRMMYSTSLISWCDKTIDKSSKSWPWRHALKCVRLWFCSQYKVMNIIYI